MLCLKKNTNYVVCVNIVIDRKFKIQIRDHKYKRNLIFRILNINFRNLAWTIFKSVVKEAVNHLCNFETLKSFVIWSNHTLSWVKTICPVIAQIWQRENREHDML